MAPKPTGATAPIHAPIGREAFLSIRLTRDPDEAFAAVCRILEQHERHPGLALERCSTIVGGFGVEALALADGSELQYVNKGDTYDATLCYTDADGYFVSSWGDVYEAADRAREEEEGERRCAYCSAWCEPGEPCGACGRDPETGYPFPEPLRHVKLETGHTLRTWDPCRIGGRTGYELRDPAGAVLFHGADFGPGAATAIDSDEALRGLLGFLTLRPGDTDAEYFAAYTPEQTAFAQSSDCELLQFLYGSDEGPGTFADVDADGEEGGAS